MRKIIFNLFLTLGFMSFVNCSKTPAADIPLVTPPVKAAVPSALSSAPAFRSPIANLVPGMNLLDAADFKSRFFTNGPTSIFGILGVIDERINEINTRSQDSSHPCILQEPVAYSLSKFAEGTTFYAQCYDKLTGDKNMNVAGDPAFFQFGKKDGVTYLYVAVGAQWVAAKVTPAPEDAKKYKVEAWLGVGYLNATTCGTKQDFDGCSYGVVHLLADSSKSKFEMTAAGGGFGYCGAQLKSDGSKIYGIGSMDTGMSCVDTHDICVEASDIATLATCDAGLTTFDLGALGRLAGSGLTRGAFAESKYPGAGQNTIMLNGTATDSLRFGPVQPTTGVGEF